MFNHKLIALGADPEVFFVRKDGTPQSVEGLIGGSKHDPLPMVGLAPGFMVQEDNVAAEYNIPPATNADQFDHHIMSGLKFLVGVARKHKCKIAVTDVLHFPKEQLDTVHAQTLGCEPDFNIWEGEMNPRPKPPGDWRTAAGHVHISWTNPDEQSAVTVGRMADLFLGVPALLVTQKSLRRELYGKSGAWRFKKYGGEYRSLPNFWIASRQHRQHVWNAVELGFHRLQQQQQYLIEEMEEFGPEIQHTINTHDLDSAVRLIEKFNLQPFPKGAKFDVTL